MIRVSIDDVVRLPSTLVDPTCQLATRIIATNVGVFCVNASSVDDVAISFDDILLDVPQKRRVGGAPAAERRS